MKILVTGGVGFVGSHLCDALISKGHSVRVIDNLSAGDQNLSDLQKAGVEFVNGDVGEYDQIDAATQGMDVVFHLAAMNRAGRSIADPIGAHKSNATGTLNVFETARQHKLKKIVFVSSSSVLGGSERVLKEDDPYHPLHPYGVGKACGEMYASNYFDLFKLPVATLRYFSIYGPRQRGDIDYAAVIAKFVYFASEGKPLTVYGDGEQLRNYTHVTDAVAGTIACMESDATVGKIINMANTQEHSIIDIVEAIKKEWGGEIEVKNEPLPAPEPKRNFPDLSLAKELLGWAPKVSLEQGVREYIAWHKTLSHPQKP